MSQSQMNGHAATPQEKFLSAEQQLDAILEPILGTVINGSLLTVQGCPPEHIARSIARITGKVLGRIVCQGPLPAVLQVRSTMKEGFAKAMDSVSPTPPSPQAGVSLHRPPQG